MPTSQCSFQASVEHPLTASPGILACGLWKQVEGYQRWPNPMPQTVSLRIALTLPSTRLARTTVESAYCSGLHPSPECNTMTKAACGPIWWSENHPRSEMPPIKRVKASQAWTRPRERMGAVGWTRETVQRPAVLLNFELGLASWLKKLSKHPCTDHGGHGADEERDLLSTLSTVSV